MRLCSAFLLTVLLVAALCGAASAQALGNAGSIQGRVLDPSGAVVVGATVDIVNPVSGFKRTTTTDVDGRFTIRNVPQHAYHLAVQAKNFAPVQQDVDVRSGAPNELEITLPLAKAATTVEVTAEASDLLETNPSAHVDLDEKVAERIPLEPTGSGLSQLITLSSPGVAADSNGFFHPLGDHAQTSFSVDNQNISDQQSRVYSNQISPDAIQSIELITGVAPAEYGDKTSLVAVVTTKSGLGLQKPTGAASFGYGSFGSPSANLSLGVGGPKVGNYVAITGLRTGRYLDGPEFQTLHDLGNNETLFDRVDYQAGKNDTLRLNIFLGRSWFQVPNTFDQQADGRDQRQLMKTWNFAPGWTHLFGANTLLTANAYARQDRVNYYPSADRFADQPETVNEDRRLTNSGFHIDLSHVKGRHNVKLGVQYSHTALAEHFQFAVTDPTVNPVCLDSSGNPVTTPALTNPGACAGAGFAPNPALNPGLVPFDLTRGGNLLNFRDNGAINQAGLYGQDNITLGNLNLMLGLRVDHYDGPTTNTEAQPRVGLAYRIASTNTVLRGSYGRTMETPYNENLLLSSASAALGIGNIFASTANRPIEPGIRNQFNAGFQQAIGKYLVIDGDYFWKYTRNAFDFNVLGDTPIAFPIAWNKSKLDGFAVRVSTPEWRGLRAYTTMGHTRARYFNPEVGGLFFDQNPPTGVFRIDHDQAFQQTTNVQYTFAKNIGGFAVFTWRYDSGAVAGSVPDYATALTLTPDQQAAIGLFCGAQVATLTAPITSCNNASRGALRLVIPADGTENDDHNPPRIAPRHLFDAGIGFDNLFHTERVKWTAKFTALNLTNKVALYNFLSTFSGTHFVTPRAYEGQLGFTF